MAKRQVFFSFYYDEDVWRVAQVRNIGTIEGQPLFSDNGWEKVRRTSDEAIKRWIDKEMSMRSCVVVLIGEHTASRKWVKYEIEQAWKKGKGIVGIYIHKLENLKDMMYDTSVTIVIISPNMKKSEWIDWEIEYCLKNITRKNRTSHTNGVVGVIMKHNGGYSWFKHSNQNEDGCLYISYDETKIYDIINNNRFNQNPKVYSCTKCKTVNALTGSYIAYVTEEDFLSDPNKYINNAYDKSENDALGYDLVKTR